MSSVLVYTRRAGSKRKKTAVSDTERIEKFFIGLILFLLMIILIEVAFHFFIAPSLSIKKIEIVASTNLGLSDSEILRVSGLYKNINYFDVKSHTVASRLLAIPTVKEAVVKKVFPSTVFLKITERTPVGVCFAGDSKGLVPIAVDEEGVLFPFKQGTGFTDYPIISGVNIPFIKNGARLPRPLSSFLDDLDNIRKVSPELYSLISEVKFVKKNGLDYDVILYPTTSKIRVRIGDNLDIKMLKYIIMILDVISMQPAMDNLEEIDLRTGEVVYRIRGE